MHVSILDSALDVHTVLQNILFELMKLRITRITRIRDVRYFNSNPINILESLKENKTVFLNTVYTEIQIDCIGYHITVLTKDVVNYIIYNFFGIN